VKKSSLLFLSLNRICNTFFKKIRELGNGKFKFNYSNWAQVDAFSLALFSAGNNANEAIQ